jgi:hypothetical protein
MGSVVKGMDKAMESMNLERVSFFPSSGLFWARISVEPGGWRDVLSDGKVEHSRKANLLGQRLEIQLSFPAKPHSFRSELDNRVMPNPTPPPQLSLAHEIHMSSPPSPLRLSPISSAQTISTFIGHKSQTDFPDISRNG